MKFKYLKISGSFVWGKNTVTKDDLIEIRKNIYDHLVNVEEGLYYDADKNEWLAIGGDRL